MYGSSTVLVLSLDNTLNGYTLDPNIGEFLLTHPKMKLGSKKIYSVNEGNASKFNPAVKEYVDSLKYPKNGEAPFSARYVGSMVADVYISIFFTLGSSNNPLWRCLYVSHEQIKNPL